jgi:hypothetical protein
MLQKSQKIFKQLGVDSEFFIVVASIFGITLIVFRRLVLNLGTHLLDWNDYPYYVWTIYQNVAHFSSFQLNGFFNTNSFYPHQGTLLFSDILLPQSVIAWCWTMVIGSYSDHPILVFNLTFFTSILLNIIAAYTVSKKLFSASAVRFLATLTLALSPFFFLQFGHLQMVSFWPSLFALSIVLNKNTAITAKNAIIAGALLGLQFYASVYLAIFSVTIIGILFIAQLLSAENWQQWLRANSKHFILLAAVFAVLAGPLLYKYKTVQEAYGVGINYSEYVYYAAHLTDYLFFIPNSTVGEWLAPWNRFNLHNGGEPIKNPGIMLSLLAIIGIFTIAITPKNVSIKVSKLHPDLLFLLVLLAGFIFSLGPRLNVNGSFVNLPLPYHLLVKVLPIMEPIRATSRWYFIFYLGVWYFAMSAVQRLNTKRLTVIALILSLVYIAEIMPVSVNASAKDYYPADYKIIEESCSQTPKVLLEFPITPFKENNNIIDYLQYRTSALIASTRHHCLLINGYSGLTPKEHVVYDQELFKTMQENDLQSFVTLLKSNDVSLIKYNPAQLNPDLGSTVSAWLKNNQYFSTLSQSDQTTVVQVINSAHTNLPDSLPPGE